MKISRRGKHTKHARRGRHTKHAGKHLKYKSKKFRASKRYHRGNKRTYKRGRRFHKGGEPEEEITNADDFKERIKPYFFQRQDKNKFEVTSYQLIISTKKANIDPLFPTTSSDFRKNAIVTLKCQKGTGFLSSPRDQKFSLYISYNKDDENNVKVYVLFTREDNIDIKFDFRGTPSDVADMLVISKLINVTNERTKEKYSFNFTENEEMFKAISETILKYEPEAKETLTDKI